MILVVYLQDTPVEGGRKGSFAAESADPGFSLHTFSLRMMSSNAGLMTAFRGSKHSVGS